MDKTDINTKKITKRKKLLIYFAIALGIMAIAGVLGAITGRLILDNIIQE